LCFTAPPKIVYEQLDDYPSPEKSYSRNCTGEGNPLPHVWWEKERDGEFVVVTTNKTLGLRYADIRDFILCYHKLFTV